MYCTGDKGTPLPKGHLLKDTHVTFLDGHSDLRSFQILYNICKLPASS